MMIVVQRWMRVSSCASVVKIITYFREEGMCCPGNKTKITEEEEEEEEEE